ncbi:MAG: outer membrane protein assembly factor BamE [Burkholderiaceae bacterium]|jgi:outer membrane protein assembly factor BamE|nr:outer membrane protein assembly factor BamE [Burkholderiaceae bacterium]
MSATSLARSGLFIVAVAGSLGLSACGTRSFLYTISPYRIEVQQGNLVSKEQLETLKTGMTREQVRDILGTPLLTDVFHKDRWDYIFTIDRPGITQQKRRLTVVFADDRLASFEGDEMPSENDFVATLDTHGKPSKIPRLDATEEELAKHASNNAASATSNQEAPFFVPTDAPPLPDSYPPLDESSSQ